jgi:transposase-like protein
MPGGAMVYSPRAGFRRLMHCKRCKVKMREERRSFHKKRKWICPKCGRARMQGAGSKDGKRKPPVHHEH